MNKLETQFFLTLFCQLKTQNIHASYVSELLARGVGGGVDGQYTPTRGPPDCIMRPAASFVNCN